MFREIRVTKQPGDGRKRRWYQSDYFDLFVWYVKHDAERAPDRRREFVGMQLCYDITSRQRTLEWHKTRGFVHHRVDKASDSLTDHGAAAAELIAGGRFDAEVVVPRFMKEAGSLPPLVRDFVIDKLVLYAREQQPADRSPVEGTGV